MRVCREGKEIVKYCPNANSCFPSARLSINFQKQIQTRIFMLEITRIMKTKLTLSLDQGVIERAKRYAVNANQSVSSLVENYLNQLGEESKDQEEDLPPIIKKWKGCLSLPLDFDWKADKAERIHRKYWLK